MPNTSIIYKITTESEWQKAEEAGSFDGAAIDLKDGYIHFSTKEQVIETAEKHFKDIPDLLLVAVSTKNMSDKLIYEPSRGGALFPHLYEALDLSHVMWKKPFPIVDGKHQFPDSN